MDRGDRPSTLYLVDGFGFIFRGFHALPRLTSPQGEAVGAILGFCNMLLRIYEEKNPVYWAIVLDDPAPTFRHEWYPAYKAQREEAPEDLKSQISIIKTFCHAFSIPTVQQAGYEADDLLAAYARQGVQEGFSVEIISSDKDMMQLMSDRVALYDPLKNKYLSMEDVQEKWGVDCAAQIPHVHALAGDKSDNIPGLPGIGPKTAAAWIREFGTLQGLLDNAHQMPSAKKRTLVEENHQQLLLYYRLVTLDYDVPGLLPLQSFQFVPPHSVHLGQLCKKYGLENLYQRLVKKDWVIPEITSQATWILETDVLLWARKSGQVTLVYQETGGDNPGDYTMTHAKGIGTEIGTEEDFLPLEGDSNDEIMDEVTDKATEDSGGLMNFDQSKFDQSKGHPPSLGKDFNENTGGQAHKNFSSLASKDPSWQGPPWQGEFFSSHAFETEHNTQKKVFWITPDGTGDQQYKGGQLILPHQQDLFDQLMQDPTILKICHDQKKWMHRMAEHRPSQWKSLDDGMVLSYLVRWGHGDHRLEGIFSWIQGQNQTLSTACRSCPHEWDDTTRKELESESHKAFLLWKAHSIFMKRILSQKMAYLYYGIERPLIAILYVMEKTGVLVDVNVLQSLSQTLAGDIAILEEDIQKTAGVSFNVASPKQLGDVLFQKLQWPGGKKTKSGAYQTSVGVLEDLVDKGYVLAEKILKWRQLSKLKNTYADPLPAMVSPQTGRLSTHYSMVTTSTGRLSSVNPNLQNIPIRTSQGQSIRKAFRASLGCQWVRFDYSQMELRLLAHMGKIASLQRAFCQGRDIHQETAASLFECPFQEVTPEMRRQAKIINFSLIYGVTPFGLAKQLHTSPEKAQIYMAQYFEKFPEVQDFLQSTKEFAQTHGYVQTLFGRRCAIPDILSSKKMVRLGAERQAINAPIQGTSADIMKLGMVRIQDLDLPAVPLLQIHDELILEVAVADIPRVVEAVKKALESVVSLSVPLQVNAAHGFTWNDG